MTVVKRHSDRDLSDRDLVVGVAGFALFVVVLFVFMALMSPVTGRIDSNSLPPRPPLTAL